MTPFFFLCRGKCLTNHSRSAQDALKELEELKKIVPREALVYFLIGKVSFVQLCV